MASTMVLPVSLSSRFFDGSNASELHGIHRDDQDEQDPLTGTSLRANGRTGHAVIGEGREARMQAVNDLECVLLWDAETRVRSQRSS